MMLERGKIQTVQGEVSTEELSIVLPHEHLFTDLRGPHVEGYAIADPSDVVAALAPYLNAAYDAGVTALVECSTVGVGRNVSILKHLAESTKIHIIAPTGVYREAYIPSSLRELSEIELAEIWISDIKEGIDGTEIKAGFIKLAVSDEGITPLERRNLKAAAMASQRTGAVIACHTTSGALFLEEAEILEAAGLVPDRFIWVHANIEEDKNIHLHAAQKGYYVEFDAIGADWASREDLLEGTLNLINAGFADRILLSHDAGWYDPSQPDGHPPEGGIRGYTTLFEDFIPALKARGVSDEIVEQITKSNPARAFCFG
jgi:phosphotriesterase-related protein